MCLPRPQKHKRDVERLVRLGVMDQTVASVTPVSSREDRIQELQQIYEEVELQYQNVLEKLAADV